jgi:Uma2 family endonuclease
MIAVPSTNLRLPTAAELPDSDETPVDNELQNETPNLLLEILRWIWSDRSDWFWGIDMAVYYEPDLAQPENSKFIVPDGFLALGVEQRRPDEGGRLSYAMWQEKVPILVLEIVSKTYNSEYDDKLTKYESLGILYYVICNPLSSKGSRKKRRQFMDVYKLVNGKYELLSLETLPEGGRMVWLDEIGLGIGYERGMRGDWQRDWLYWYDHSGVKYPTDNERAEQEKLAKEQAEAIALQQRLDKERAEEIALQERLDKERAEAIALQERLDKERAEAIALQERLDKERAELAKQEAEVIALQEKLAKEQAEAIALQERLDKEQAEVIATQERQEKLQERQEKEKLAAYLRSLGINPDEI